MAKKERADSAHKASEIAASALRKYAPPPEVGLKNQHLVYWDKIIKARHEWSDIDLVIAAQLAMALDDLVIIRKKLEQEGLTVLGGKHGNTPVENPLMRSIENTTRRVTMLAQKLQVHAQATMGDPRDSKRKNKAKQEFIEAFGEDEDDLIARPN